MLGSNKAVLAALGLEGDESPRPLPLTEGVVLTIRPPTSIDWGIARSRISGVVEARDILAATARTYGWTAQDVTDLAVDETLWTVAAEHMVYSELAVRVVTAATGPNGPFEPTLPNFCQLFRRPENLALFRAGVQKAEGDILRAKKE